MQLRTDDSYGGANAASTSGINDEENICNITMLMVSNLVIRPDASLFATTAENVLLTSYTQQCADKIAVFPYKTSLDNDEEQDK